MQCGKGSSSTWREGLSHASDITLCWILLFTAFHVHVNLPNIFPRQCHLNFFNFAIRDKLHSKIKRWAFPHVNNTNYWKKVSWHPECKFIQKKRSCFPDEILTHTLKASFSQCTYGQSRYNWAYKIHTFSTANMGTWTIYERLIMVVKWKFNSSASRIFENKLQLCIQLGGTSHALQNTISSFPTFQPDIADLSWNLGWCSWFSLWRFCKQCCSK